MDPQRIRAHVSWLHSVDQSENIAGHQPASQCHLLHLIEVVHASIVTALFLRCPQVELQFCDVLPFIGLIIGHIQHVPVYPALQLKPHTDNIGSVGVNRTGCDRRGHVQDPGPLS